MPAATAAAEPPLEPPAMCSGFQGLRHGPSRRDSVVPVMPRSGVFVLPRITSPAARWRFTSSESSLGTTSRVKTLPLVIGMPATSMPRSFTRKGTPRNGPSGSAPRATRRASS